MDPTQPHQKGCYQPIVAACIKIQDSDLINDDIKLYMFSVDRDKATEQNSLTTAFPLSDEVIKDLDFTIMLLSRCDNSPNNKPAKIIIVKGPGFRQDADFPPYWMCVFTFCKGPLARMFSRSLGNNVFSLNPKVYISFWNSIRGCIEEGERGNLQWLTSYCCQRFYGNSEMSSRLTAEDLLEHLSRDTTPFRL